MGVQPKSLFGLRKRLAMGQRPAVSANANGPMPMMKKGGKVCMKKGGHATKHHDKKMHHGKKMAKGGSAGGHNMVKECAPAYKKGGHAKKAKKFAKGGHVKHHAHGHHHMKSHGVHKMHHGHKV